MPTRKTNSQIRSDGTCGPLQVGMVLVLGEGIRVTDPQWVTWSSQLTSAVAMGPCFKSVGSHTDGLVDT